MRGDDRANTEIPSKMSTIATANSIAIPSRGGIVSLNRMMAPPTTNTVTNGRVPMRSRCAPPRRRAAQPLTIAGYRDDMVGIGRMPHPENQSQKANAERSGVIGYQHNFPLTNG